MSEQEISHMGRVVRRGVHIDVIGFLTGERQFRGLFALGMIHSPLSINLPVRLSEILKL